MPGWRCFTAAIVGNSVKFARNSAKSAFCDVTKLQMQVCLWLGVKQMKSKISENLRTANNPQFFSSYKKVYGY